jgi:type IV secretory pathway TrbL component
MPKAMLVLLVLFVAGLGFVLYLGGKQLLGGAPTDTVEVEEPAQPAKGGNASGEAGSKAQALLDQATSKARKVAADAAAALRGPVIRLTLDETPIVVEAGTPKDVKIRRSNDEKMEALQLRFVPAAGSKLSVKGGAFAKGASEATFTVEALAAGLDASLTIEAGSDVRMVVPIRVK